tara:strand:- start:243 stop:386 length:144 start_codon:yes stop_codon:yes gene_type:complete
MNRAQRRMMNSKKKGRTQLSHATVAKMLQAEHNDRQPILIDKTKLEE